MWYQGIWGLRESDVKGNVILKECDFKWNMMSKGMQCWREWDNKGTLILKGMWFLSQCNAMFAILKNMRFKGIWC